LVLFVVFKKKERAVLERRRQKRVDSLAAVGVGGGVSKCYVYYIKE
jgi:hypothetical protein